MKKSALLLVLALVFLEWLDFSLYLYLAKSIFASQFFPASSFSLTLSFGLFTVAYFARPLGGWLFGGRADNFGRRSPMIASSALMGFATIAICLLPSYAQIGLWAAWGLLILRALQGLALGGEINTSAMFLVEHHPKRPLLAGSFVAASGAAGMFTGAAFAALLSFSGFDNAWRLVFALIGGLSLWVCCLRKQLKESPEFKKHKSLPITHWWLYWRGLWHIAVAGLFVSVSVYMCNVFWVSFAIDNALWGKTQCVWIGALAQLASALLALPIAWFSKPFWAQGLMRLSMMIMIATAPVLFYCTNNHCLIGVIVALMGYVLANGLLCAALYYFLYQQLPALCRCQGVSLVWAIAASIGTISLPLSQQAISYGLTWFPGALVSLIAILCLLGIFSKTKVTY